MILAELRHADRYARLLPGLDAGLEFLRSLRADQPVGRHEIDGERVFALVDRYRTTPGLERRWESHRRYVDLQFVAEGRERLLHCDASALEPDEPYDATRDVVFYREPRVASSVLLSSGCFAILFPEDAHKPGCMAGGREEVRKVVVKIELEQRAGAGAP